VIGSVQSVVLDCPDVMALARFYHALLGGAINAKDRRWSVDEGWATLHAESGVVLAFARAVDRRPPQWPDPAWPQQFHLDVGVADLDAAHQQVLALGATLLEAGADDRDWRVYADPAGHPFCLVRE
jgi:hypothetical protein